MIATLEKALSQRAGRRLVFTNGVFDILHAGHIESLRRASELGDLLYVAINTDASAKRLGKGPTRPLNSAEDRAEVLAAIRYVDLVLVFDEDTPADLIRQLKPEFYVKGGDYSEEALPEAPVVKAFGGKVVIVPLLEGRSTTDILKRSGKQ